MTDQSRKAWVTLLTNPSYLAGAVILYRTLRAVSQYPLIIMATDALPDSSIALLEYYGLQVLKVPHLTPADGQHPGFDPTFVRLNDAWTKLQVFGLTSYDRLILIDCDMVFLRSMDEVFDMELPGPDWIAAAPACVCNPFKIAHYPADWIPANCSLTKQIPKTPLYSPTIPSLDGPRTSHLLNSGMVLLTPSSSTMAAIQHFLDTSPTVAKASFADQDVIAEFFKGRWRPLPWWANALKPQRAVHADLWEDTEARLVHYILDKPWKKRPAYLKDLVGPPIPTATTELPKRLVELVPKTPPQTSLTDYDAIHGWWWVVFDDVVSSLNADGQEGLVTELRAFVDRS